MEQFAAPVLIMPNDLANRIDPISNNSEFAVQKGGFQSPNSA